MSHPACLNVILECSPDANQASFRREGQRQSIELRDTGLYVVALTRHEIESTLAQERSPFIAETILRSPDRSGDVALLLAHRAVQLCALGR